MRNQLLLAASVFLIFAGSFAAQGLLSQPAGGPTPDGQSCRRIVSMAPSITETLSALGLAERVVGASWFGGAASKPHSQRDVGGYLDPNFEAVLALRPDLVILLVEQRRSMPAFDKLHLRTLAVSHQDVAGILDSLALIGRRCGVAARAREVLGDIATRLERIRQQTAGLPRPRVMVTVYRTLGSGRLQNVCIAASDGHLGRIVELAGGQNAYRHSTVRFPIVSGEAVLHINPEVIIDLVREQSLVELGREAILADWQQVAEVAAVRNRRVCVLGDDHAVIPGPDFVGLVEKFARLIHPEADVPSAAKRGLDSPSGTP
jgi:iron complex transport system substrate-binding protein